MKKLSLILALLSAFVVFSPRAHADSITYTFTGGDSPNIAAGTNFTYVDPNGFLSFDSGLLAATTAGDLFFFGTDFGQLTSFDFVSPTEIKLFSSTHVLDSLYFTAPYQISSLTPGEPVPSNLNGVETGTLAITNTAAVTPEPSSLVLLGTGLLGAIGAVRRRVRHA